jgi:hypothetical protein
MFVKIIQAYRQSLISNTTFFVRFIVGGLSVARSRKPPLVVSPSVTLARATSLKERRQLRPSRVVKPISAGLKVVHLIPSLRNRH